MVLALVLIHADWPVTTALLLRTQQLLARLFDPIFVFGHLRLDRVHLFDQLLLDDYVHIVDRLLLTVLLLRLSILGEHLRFRSDLLFESAQLVVALLFALLGDRPDRVVGRTAFGRLTCLGRLVTVELSFAVLQFVSKIVLVQWWLNGVLSRRLTDLLGGLLSGLLGGLLNGLLGDLLSGLLSSALVELDQSLLLPEILLIITRHHWLLLVRLSGALLSNGLR